MTDTHTRTHGHTDTQTQATTIPEGQKLASGKNVSKKGKYMYQSDYERAIDTRYLTMGVPRGVYCEYFIDY